MKFFKIFIKFSWVFWFILIFGCQGEKAKMPSPAAPSDLAATAVSTTQIDLAWQDHTDYEEGFRIERKTGSSSYALLAEIPLDTVSYSDTGLNPDAAYSYRVYAFNQAGDSNYSNEVTVQTLSNLPGAPSGLVAEAVPGHQINLSWSAGSNNQDGFEIERKAGDTGTYVFLGTLGAGVLTYSDVNLTPGVDYYYRLRAFNLYGNSIFSNEASARALEPASQVSAGGFHTCALLPGGKVQCWGDNSYGQLGNGTTTSVNVPVPVSGLTEEVAAISSGDSHTCVLTHSGGVKCWGRNDDGQLGMGDSTGPESCWENIPCSKSPVDVTGLGSGVAVVSAGMRHTCAVIGAGKAECWGYDGYGQLGDGNKTGRSAVPVDVAGFASGVTGISAGAYHTCAVTSVGAVKCWGWNDSGQLGIGTNNGPEYCTADLSCSSTPLGVSGITSGFTAVSAGGLHSCALNYQGRIQCWGYNGDGELGDGGSSGYNANPVGVFYFNTDLSLSNDGAQEISAGAYHTCALTTGGGLKCWGTGEAGQLGNGTTVRSKIPEAVTGLSSGVIGVSSGAWHTCALIEGGWAKCWGNNDYGQLGDGTQTLSDTPVGVVGIGP